MRVNGVFETMRCYGGRVFAERLHLERLRRGCSSLGLKVPEEGLLELALRTIIRAKRLKNARLRLKVVRLASGPQMVASARALKGLKKIQRGLSVLVCQKTAFRAGALTAIKSLDRAFYEALLRKALKAGYDEAVFCDRHGHVVEGARTNVFIVRDGEVVTPPLDSGCLPGITRRIVLGLLKRMGVRCQERKISRRELLSADEVFLTNSVMEVVPVLRLGKKPVAAAKAGVVTRKVRAAYEKEVEKACGFGYNK